MISLYSGTPGSGKSCHAAREIALRLQRKDSVVIGNFYFNTKAVKKCKGVYLYVPNHRLDPGVPEYKDIIIFPLFHKI